jgi:hypothetical protein
MPLADDQKSAYSSQQLLYRLGRPWDQSLGARQWAEDPSGQFNEFRILEQSAEKFVIHVLRPALQCFHLSCRSVVLEPVERMAPDRRPPFGHLVESPVVILEAEPADDGLWIGGRVLQNSPHPKDRVDNLLLAPPEGPLAHHHPNHKML